MMPAPTPELQHSISAAITQAKVRPVPSLLKNDFSTSVTQMGTVTLPTEERGPHQPHVSVGSQLSHNI